MTTSTNCENIIRIGGLRVIADVSRLDDVPKGVAPREEEFDKRVVRQDCVCVCVRAHARALVSALSKNTGIWNALRNGAVWKSSVSVTQVAV